MQPLRSPLLRRWLQSLSLCCAAALVLAQAQGFMHGIVHDRHDVVSSESPVVPAQHPHAEAGWVDKLFGGHGDEAACRLFDQTSHSDLAPVLITTVSPLGSTCSFLGMHAALAPLPLPALFQARGPPALR